MDKSRIFIASSGRTLTLAEKLRDDLRTDFCEATLWSEEGRRQPGATIIEMLQNVSTSYDFAVILLAKDDVMVRSTGDALKARDNCVFEAGMFMSSLGRDRCFLVNSVAQTDLPSDLGGIISLPFAEPADLTDREACAKAVRIVGATVKDTVQRLGRPAAQQRIPILSLEEVLRLERLQADGGDLREGQVVVCDLQPNTGADVAHQIGRNLRNGVSYLYFLYLGEDTIDKVLLGLQVLATDSREPSGQPADFNDRLEVIRQDGARVLDRLSSICQTRSLIISLIPTEPQFCFRVHNASDPLIAKLYLRFRDGGFMPWSEGAAAFAVWRSLPHWMPADDQDRLFVPPKQLALEGDALRRFEQSLEKGLNRYFPGLQDGVRRLCIGPDE
jgi:hypothetical protein